MCVQGKRFSRGLGTARAHRAGLPKAEPGAGSAGHGAAQRRRLKRSVGWSTATAAAGVAGFRVHDLRHTAASVWLAAGADPKVVQRVLGHASAAMTMDLYGHLIDGNLWHAARAVGGISGASELPGPPARPDDENEAGESAW